MKIILSINENGEIGNYLCHIENDSMDFVPENTKCRKEG